MDAHTVLILEHKGASGTVAEIGLNRIAARHALTAHMARTITHALRDWYHRPDVVAIILRGHEGHFCAGGDLRGLYQHMDDPSHAQDDLFADEYRLLDLMHAYPKPIVALLSGFVLGAGAGLAAQARFRVADASVQWGMPELQIGLFPDVGSRYFLRQLSQPLALYLAMSSVRLSASDLSFAGFIDAVVDTDAFVTIKDALCATSWDHLIGDAPAIAEKVKACLLEQTTDQPLAPSSLARHHQTILKAFANINQADALAELAADSPWGAALATSIQSYAPAVRAWIWHLFREAPIPASYRAALSGDYRLGQHFLSLPDFKEGIRAAIIDKDRQPVWSDFDPSAFQKHLAAWQAADQEDALNWVWV